jgi:hypothetical protein
LNYLREHFIDFKTYLAIFLKNKFAKLPGGKAQWSSRPPPEQKIPGSNPARV